MIWTRFALFLTLSFAAAQLALSVGCTPPDDDDVVVDDDDAADDDDASDDDDTLDDDIPANFASLAALMTVTCGDDPPPGDDDDSGADDDDSGADDDDSGDPGPEPCSLQIDYVVQYFVDIQSNQLACEQHLAATGEVVHGFGSAAGCPNCSASFTIDPTTWQDVSDPAADPDHCDPAALEAQGLGLGDDLMSGAGDFGQGAFLSASVHAALGSDYAVGGGMTEADISANYADADLAYAGLIFWETLPGSAAEGLAGADLFVPEGDAGQFQPTFIVYYDPAANLEADPSSPDGWRGLHGAGSTFYYTLQ